MKFEREDSAGIKRFRTVVRHFTGLPLVLMKYLFASIYFERSFRCRRVLTEINWISFRGEINPVQNSINFLMRLWNMFEVTRFMSNLLWFHRNQILFVINHCSESDEEMRDVRYWNERYLERVQQTPPGRPRFPSFKGRVAEE